MFLKGLKDNTTVHSNCCKATFGEGMARSGEVH